MPIEVDRSQLQQLAEDARAESSDVLKQWTLWLGLGSAGGAVALVSLASALPNPAFALSYFLPSMWAFLFGVLAAGAAMLVASARSSASSVHYAASYNHWQYSNALSKMPEVISSPGRLADEANAQRDEFIASANSMLERGNKAWKAHRRWHRIYLFASAMSSLAFLSAFAWPLVRMTLGEFPVP